MPNFDQSPCGIAHGSLPLRLISRGRSIGVSVLVVESAVSDSLLVGIVLSGMGVPADDWVQPVSASVVASAVATGNQRVWVTGHQAGRCACCCLRRGCRS